MNRVLQGPFAEEQDVPDTSSGALHSGHSVTVRFNRKGDLLASGRTDGKVVVWDVETLSIARKLCGHTRQIQSLSWSRSGRYLLTGAQDSKAVLWDLQHGTKLRVVKFQAQVYIAELHPTNHLKFVASLFEDQPKLVDVTARVSMKYNLPSAPKRPDEDIVSEKQAAQDAKVTTTVSVFTADGTHILTGTNKGYLNIIEANTQKTIYTTKICSGMILTLRLTNSGQTVVINSVDKAVRTVQLPNLLAKNLDPDEIHLETEHKFEDLVNNTPWNHVSFNSTGEYISGSRYNAHAIHIWERFSPHGSLVKILEGPKEEQGVVEWHPHRPFIAAVGLETGKIHLWSVPSAQRWSALAPDFEEVDENVEYIEGEGEFDIHPQEEIQKRQLELEDDIDIDVFTIEPVQGEIVDEEDAFTMPVLFDQNDASEDEFITIGTGTMRRKSPKVEYVKEEDLVGDAVESMARKSKTGKTKKR